MKKFLGLFIIMVSVFVASAQTAPTEVTPDAYLYDASYVYIFETDTITDADNVSFVFRVKGTKQLDFNIKLYSDWISGTAGGTLIAHSSPDGVNYAPIDTITITGVTADAMDAEVITIRDYLYPYIKLVYTQTGTAVTVPRPYVYTKF